MTADKRGATRLVIKTDHDSILKLDQEEKTTTKQSSLLPLFDRFDACIAPVKFDSCSTDLASRSARFITSSVGVLGRTLRDSMTKQPKPPHPKYPCDVCGRYIADIMKDKHRESRLCAAYARTQELRRAGYMRCKSSARPIECAGIDVVRDHTVYTARPADPQYHVIKVPWAPCWAALVAESCGRLSYQEYKRNQLRRKLLISASADPSWRDTLEAIYKLGGDQKAIDEIVHRAAQRLR